MRIGAWSVEPLTHQIERDGQSVKLEARTMRLLECLAERPGETVTTDELMNRVWPGVVVTQDSVYQAVASLRRILGDDSKTPKYIVTVPRRGYRLVAPVGMDPSPASNAPSHPAKPASPSRPAIEGFFKKALWASAILSVLAVALFLFFPHRNDTRSVAVLPFLDLTSQDMAEEYFADGMTEELIDQLSKIPGLRVPSATASFYYKGRQLPVAAIADSLHVAYVLDGSVRRSGATLRIATRLVRASDGFVIWSETYDRASADTLAVQEDIARRVARALR
jgi:TolB-like protein/DNA-binding winged helix-turn-helix (wHTH) protein